MGQPTTALKQLITFAHGAQAQVVTPPPGTAATTILQALGIARPSMLLLLIGGAAGLDATQQGQLSTLVSRGVARACATSSTLILDGGTKSGIMELIGQGVAEQGRKTPLLGVAPRGKVTYPGGPPAGSIDGGAELDPNHSHFVLAPSDTWGSEIDLLFALAEVLAQGIPVIALLVNGGEGAKHEALQIVRHGWPLLVVEGSGRLADEIATLVQGKTDAIQDAALAEILAQGHIDVFSIKQSPEALVRLLQHFDQYALLKQIWQRFATYDQNAVEQQKLYRRLRRWILWLGLLSTLLVVLQKSLELQRLFPEPGLLDQILHYAILATPILLTMLFAGISRFHMGARWIALRAGAEGIKAEIYRYRMRAMDYARPPAGSTPELLLSHRVSAIENKVVESDANITRLFAYTGPLPPKMYGAEARDDGLSPLTPEWYLAIRLGDQITYYEKKTAGLEQQLRRSQWLIYVFGGVGTLLAAISLELWVALTTALVATATTFLESEQTENTLKKYNQAKTKLKQVAGWWGALSPQERASQAGIDQLVAETETALQTEHAGWVLQMQEAISHFRPSEQSTDRASDGHAPASG